MVSGSITSWEINGETVETVPDFIFRDSKITADSDCNHEIKRHLLLGRKVMTNLDSILKSRDFANKGLSSQGCGFSTGHVWMWELDYEEGWVPKNWHFWTVVLEKTLESPNVGDMGSIPGSEIPLEKEMANHSGVLAWEIPWTEEPGRLQYMESQKSQTWLSG